MDKKYFTKDEDFNITPHFKMSEMTFKDGDKYVMPDDESQRNLNKLCWLFLEPLRDCFGPIVLNSGYRDLLKNASVKGAANSYHLYGCACDIRVPTPVWGNSLYWGIRFMSFLLVTDGHLDERHGIAELIFHKEQNYIHLAMRRNENDKKFYLDIV